MKKMNFLKRMQVLQSVMLVCVILMILALIRTSAILPGISVEADEQKERAKQQTYEKEYIRGTIADRNGQAIASSAEAGGKRTYSHPYAFSNLIGYWSKIYGTSGLEKTLNKELTHSDSKENDKRGADVVLTLDANLQEQAYQAIEGFTGSVCVMDVKTGEILALASSHTFPINELEDKWQEINEEDGVFYNNAFQNPVTPGSVFKLVTSKGIIESGLEHEIVQDEGALKVNGQTIHNYNGTAYGPLDYKEGFIHSSNVYFMDRGLAMGGQKLQECADAFLLGQEIPLDFTTLRSSFDLRDQSKNVIASTAFGQGETEVTPLQMAMIAASIANDGTMMKPYLIQSVTDAKGHVIREGQSEVLTTTMTADTAATIKDAMKAAAESYELGPVGVYSDKIAAKTGTAQRGDGTNNAWLVTFAPADRPRYVIVANKLKTTDVGKVLAPVVTDLYNTLLK